MIILLRVLRVQIFGVDEGGKFVLSSKALVGVLVRQLRDVASSRGAVLVGSDRLLVVGALVILLVVLISVV